MAGARGVLWIYTLRAVETLERWIQELIPYLDMSRRGPEP